MVEFTGISGRRDKSISNNNFIASLINDFIIEVEELGEPRLLERSSDKLLEQVL